MKKRTLVVRAMMVAVMVLAACSSASARSMAEQNAPAKENAPAAGEAVTAAGEAATAAGKAVTAAGEATTAAGKAATAAGKGAPAAGEAVTAAGKSATAAEKAASKAAEPVIKTVPIPKKYKKELTVRTGEEIEEEDTIAAIYETASIEANKKLAEDLQDDDAGWLFSIGTVTEEELHDMLCGDMSYAKVFAKDANGTYYVFYHPTDVSMVRNSSGDYTKDELNHWSELTKWADSVPKTLMKENSSLKAVSFDNSEVSVMLYRTAYMEDEEYTLSTAKDGERKPDAKGAVSFVERLTHDVTFKTAETKEKPDGDYIAISFPMEEMRFDFFLTEGKKNYVRKVYVIEEEEGKFEEVEGGIFIAEYADGKTNAADIMQEWYDSLK